jgi:hypothetical protein
MIKLVIAAVVFCLFFVGIVGFVQSAIEEWKNQ